jgi:hypothetical protein
VAGLERPTILNDFFKVIPIGKKIKNSAVEEASKV